MTRKGFIDGRSLRLPTVTVRPGKPNKAASSFASGIVREPLAGVDAPCPVAPTTRMWVQSPRAVVDNLVVGPRGAHVAFTHTRSVNVPGISVAVGDMVAALRSIAGDAVADRVKWNLDPAIDRIVSTWPSNFAPKLGPSLGMRADADFAGIVRACIADGHAARVSLRMPAPPTPLDYANAVARNVVPLAGILFLDWPAANVLILYFADTLLAMAVIFAGLMRALHAAAEGRGMGGARERGSGLRRRRAPHRGLLRHPLGVPLIFMLAGSDVSWRALLADQGFRVGLGLQAIAAFWSGHALYQALRTRTPEELPDRARVRARVPALDGGPDVRVHGTRVPARAVRADLLRRRLRCSDDHDRRCAGPVPARDAGRHGGCRPVARGVPPSPAASRPPDGGGRSAGAGDYTTSSSAGSTASSASCSSSGPASFRRAASDSSCRNRRPPGIPWYRPSM